MRILGTGLLLVLAVGFLVSDGMSQSYPSGGNPGGYYPMYYGGTGPTWPMVQPSPMTRYQGYGVWPSNYYAGQVPPYLAGGPAPGYTYTYPYSYPWYGYCSYPSVPGSYNAQPYPQPTNYSPYANSSSYRPTPPVVAYYSPNPQSYKSATRSTGSKFATDTTPPAKASATPAKTVSAAKTQPAKKAWTPSAAKKENSPFSADQQQPKDKQPSLFQKLLFWQKTKD